MLCPGGEAVRFCCLAARNYEMLARGAAREERGTPSRSHSLGMRIKVLYFDTGFLFGFILERYSLQGVL